MNTVVQAMFHTDGNAAGATAAFAKTDPATFGGGF
jgi:hypothetical protein